MSAQHKTLDEPADHEAAGEEMTVSSEPLPPQQAGCALSADRRRPGAPSPALAVLPAGPPENRFRAWGRRGDDKAEAHRFCDDRRVGFDAYPMHEVAAHPDAARLLGLFNSHGGTVRGCADGRAGTMFEPLTTTGVPLAVRDDWEEVLGPNRGRLGIPRAGR